MRAGLVIVVLAAIAVSAVQTRRREVTIRHEIQRMRLAHVELRRKLWDQQVRLGYLTGPQEIRRRLEETSLTRAESAKRLAEVSRRGESSFGN